VAPPSLSKLGARARCGWPIRVALASLVVSGCGASRSDPRDAGPGIDGGRLADGGVDDGGPHETDGSLSDGGTDAGVHARTDAGIDAGIDGGPAPIAVADYCRESARIRCEANLACCGVAAQRYPSVDACLSGTSSESFCVATLEGGAFRSGAARYDPIAAVGALALLRERAASCSSPYHLDDPPVITGTLGAGADCTSRGTDYSYAVACAPGLVCGFASFSPARNACMTPVGEGAACPSYNCRSDLLCIAETAGSVCRPFTRDLSYCLYVP
jgi:hypothetical protein